MKQLYALIIEDLDLAERDWNGRLQDLLRGDLDLADLLEEPEDAFEPCTDEDLAFAHQY
jgi:hypothetical protein